MLTKKNIQDQVMYLLDQSGEIGNTTTTTVNVANALNTAHQKRLTEEQWSFMLYPSPITVAFKTGVRNYTLHPLLGMMTYFYNGVAKQDMIETPSRMRLKPEAQEDRYHWEFVQHSPCQLPSATGKLTTVGKAYISYVDINGNFVQEEVDTTQTSFSVDTVIGITNMDLTHTLVVTDIGGNTILSLAVGEVGKQYPQIRLYDDGVTGENAAYTFYRIPRTLVNDNDLPDIPFPYSNVLIYDTLLEMATYNDGPSPQYWLDQQRIWDLQMRQAFQEGEMVQSEGRTYQQTDRFEG